MLLFNIYPEYLGKQPPDNFRGADNDDFHFSILSMLWVCSHLHFMTEARFSLPTGKKLL